MEVFWAFDHGQLEIRVLAQMSRDRKLIELIQSGQDIHSGVGHELTGRPVEKIKKDRELRTAIKGIHFGIIYGLSKSSLYFTLKIQAQKDKQEFNMSEDEVGQLYDRYFQRFAGVKKWLDAQVVFGEEHGYVETLFGFHREIAQFGDDDRSTFWKNQCFNSPIQGTAHQLLLIALAIISLKKKTYNLLQRPAMEGHDAVVGYSKLRDLPETYKQGKLLLEKDVLLYVKKHWPQVDWQVPLLAEAKAGFRYGVLVPDYKGELAEEFVEKWCQKNAEFEKDLKKQMQEAA
jgi:DNA polymerase-1